MLLPSFHLIISQLLAPSPQLLEPLKTGVPVSDCISLCPPSLHLYLGSQASQYYNTTLSDCHSSVLCCCACAAAAAPAACACASCPPAAPLKSKITPGSVWPNRVGALNILIPQRPVIVRGKARLSTVHPFSFSLFTSPTAQLSTFVVVTRHSCALSQLWHHALFLR